MLRSGDNKMTVQHTTLGAKLSALTKLSLNTRLGTQLTLERTSQQVYILKLIFFVKYNR